MDERKKKRKQAEWVECDVFVPVPVYVCKKFMMYIRGQECRQTAKGERERE